MRLFHRHHHRWEPRGLEKTQHGFTRVLVRCYCGKTEVRLYEGWWTLEQLYGEGA